jgi:uncharacterized protein
MPANQNLLQHLLSVLKVKAVRDLAWVIGSPVLLDAEYPMYAGQVVTDTWCRQELEKNSDYLLALDRDPSSLLNFIEKRPTRRLGFYFETLVEYWLLHTSGFELHAHNLPVKNALRTIGEFDFLFRTHGKTVHWETAIKFYLQAEASSRQDAYVGPGGYDRLDLKVGRIFGHQLLLARSAVHQEVIDATQAYVKGMLFYPAGLPAHIPEGVSAHHLQGWWTRHRLDNIPQTSADSRWIILPRLSWLAPARLPADTAVMTLGQLSEKLEIHFQKLKVALLLAELQQDANGEWLEISRGFVVSSDWPVIQESDSSKVAQISSS